MIDIDMMGITHASGHGAKIVPDADTTSGVAASGYGATLYVLAFGDLESTLSYTLEDSEDGTDWATVVGPVNGVDGQTIVVEGVANTPASVMVKHSAVRRYHRLTAAAGAGDNYCAVVALLLQPDQTISDSVDFRLGS